MKEQLVTKREFLKIYLRILTVMQNTNRLTNQEIKVLVDICFLDSKVPTRDRINPFYGEGREMLINSNNISQSAYSNILKKLCKKGFLEKLKSKGEYALTVNMHKLVQQIHSKEVISIWNKFRILNEERSNINDSQRTQSDIQRNSGSSVSVLG